SSVPEAGGQADLSLSTHPAKGAARLRPSEAASVAAVASSDAAASAQAAAPATEAMVRQSYGRLPLSFAANVGQADSAVQFLARGSGYGLYLTATEAVMVLNQGSGVRGQGSAVRTGSPPGRGPLDAFRPGSPVRTPDPQAPSPATVVRMQVLGGTAAPAVVGRDPLPGKVNYLFGNDPAQWHTNVSTFAKVEYQNVYPGIDLVYYGQQGQLEYDFVVAPGADPQVIHLGFTGAEQVTLDGRGDLVLHAGGRHLVQHKPVVYQEVNGTRQEVASRFVLDGGQVRFDVTAYDAARPLVID